MDQIHCNPAREPELQRLCNQEEELINTLRDEVDVLSARLSGLQFTYANPTPKFDRTKVKGY